MEKMQELEWAEAQKIAITVDLVAAAKQQLRFLGEVDKRQPLHDGPGLDRAIYRYKYCWLPLLAKHVEAQVPESPLVVPLDCEWIWHCHRLNPLRYINDCKELYGKILGNRSVVSSTQAICKKQTEEIWNRMYPKEPYELNMNIQISQATANGVLQAPKSTDYDLVSAVKRQSPFYYQVSRPQMQDDTFLEGSVARYKGFLHLIKSNQESSNRQFCVPTYDIDLIWHAHQLQPVAYCKDLVGIIGRVLEHDDTDSDRTKGKKLETGFLGTTKQWEETFGSRYWRAGAMYRGSSPSPLAIRSIAGIPKKLLVEVMLEIMELRVLPGDYSENLLLTIAKKQADAFLCGKRRLSISNNREEKQIAVFQCEPVGELVCELASFSAAKVLGKASISLQDFINSGSSLSVEKWFELTPSSGTVGCQPISLRIAISFTPPVLTPFMPNLVKMAGGGNCNGGSNYSTMLGHEKINAGGNCNGGSNYSTMLGHEKINAGGNCNGGSNYSTMLGHEKINAGGNCNGGSNYSTMLGHEKINAGGNCNGGSNYSTMLGHEKINAGGNCNGGSNYSTMIGQEKINAGGNCNGGSNYSTMLGTKKINAGGHCNGGSSFNQLVWFNADSVGGDTVKIGHCIHSQCGVEDVLKSSGCGGCGGGGCGGGGCRGGCGGGCHGRCGHQSN